MGLSVVYVADTGHVVGALALTGAGAPVEVGSLVGEALPVRVSLSGGRSAVLALPDRRLAVAAVDDEPAVFAEPLAFGVDTGQDGKPRPALAQLAPWSTTLEITAGKLVLTLPASVTRLTPVLALISDGQQAHVLVGEVPAGGAQAELPVALDTGEHGALVLVAGYAGRLQEVTAP